MITHVKIHYYKSSGKYYSEGETDLEGEGGMVIPFHRAVERIQTMFASGKRPGLADGPMHFDALVTVYTEHGPLTWLERSKQNREQALYELVERGVTEGWDHADLSQAEELTGKTAPNHDPKPELNTKAIFTLKVAWNERMPPLDALRQLVNEVKEEWAGDPELVSARLHFPGETTIAIGEDDGDDAVGHDREEA